MFRRRRPLLRAAAVGGGAYLAGKHMERSAQARADQEADQDQRISDLEQQRAAGQYQQQQPPQQQQYQQPQAQPAPEPAAGPSMIDQLNQLTTLHQQGALTDEEFAAAKAKLLGG